MTQAFRLGDKQTEQAVDDMMPAYGVTSPAAMVRKALALSIVASRFANPEGVVHMLTRSGDTLQIHLRD
jgi:hypothetical protein